MQEMLVSLLDEYKWRWPDTQVILSKTTTKRCLFFPDVYISVIEEGNLNYIFVINLFLKLGIDALILRRKINIQRSKSV